MANSVNDRSSLTLPGRLDPAGGVARRGDPLCRGELREDMAIMAAPFDRGAIDFRDFCRFQRALRNRGD